MKLKDTHRNLIAQLDTYISEDTAARREGLKLLARIIEADNNFEVDMKRNLESLTEWTPEFVDLKAMSKVNYPEKYWPKKKYGEICTDDDCKAPFFTEAYLYNLLGKDDARSLLMLVRNVCNNLDGRGIWWLR